MISPTALIGPATAFVKALAARISKRRQLAAAIHAAAHAAGYATPEHLDRFCSRRFRERDLAPRARRYAKTVGLGLDLEALAGAYLSRFSPPAEGAAAARHRAAAAALARDFARALDERLLESPAWAPLLVAHQSLRTARTLERIALDRPDLTWTDVAEAARAWHLRTFSSAPESLARFGQVVNPMDRGLTPKVARPGPVGAIRAALFAAPGPVLIVGEEGVGKTWATAEALMAGGGAEDLTLLVPSRTVAVGDDVESLVLAALENRLALSAGLGWRGLLRSWFPLDGASPPPGRIILVLDGVNQSQLIDLRRLYADALGARWRQALTLAITVRPRNLPDAQAALAVHGLTPTPVPVEGYNEEELAAALVQAGRPGLSYRETSPSWQALLKTPRYFGVAVRLWTGLASMSEVTPSRLLLEDLRLRHARGDSELNPDAWASVLAELGGRLLAEPRNPLRTGDLRQALASTALDPERIEAGLRDIRSGALFEVRGPDRYAVAESRAALAIGMAAVFRLIDQAVANLPQALDQLDDLLPVLASDARAEALKAAVAIAFCWELPGAGRTIRAALLTAWLTSPNPTLADDIDAAAYAGMDPVAYLDAYEHVACGPEPDRRALWVLGPCLAGNIEAPVLAEAVLGRALRWAGMVGAREAFLSADYGEESGARTRRFRETLDEDRPAGERDVFGAHVTFLPGWDAHFLLELTALALRSRPLAPHVGVFRTAAIATAVAWPHDGFTKLRWAARLNEADPQAANAAFRSLAAELATTTVAGQPLHHVAQVAAYRLYDLVSEEIDEAPMAALDGAQTQDNRALSASYAADPGKSLVTLHPDDALVVSARTDLKPFALMRRLEQDLWDPAQDFHPSFAELVVRDANENWTPDQLSAGRSSTATDNYFRLADLALARMAPGELGRLRRSFVSEVPGRQGFGVHAGTWRTSASLAGFSAKEFEILRGLMERHLETGLFDDVVGHDRIHAIDLFDQLACHLTGEEQLELVMRPGLRTLSRSLQGVISPPSAAAAEPRLLDNPEPAARLGGYLHLALSGFEPAGRLREQIEQDALKGDGLLSGAALRILSGCGSADFARRLLASDWRWSADDAWSGHYGSLILAQFGRDIAAEEVLERIAPWLLPYAVGERGGRADEISLAAAVLEQALFRPPPPPVEPRMSVKVVASADLFAMPQMRVQLAPPDDQLGAITFGLDAAARRDALSAASERAVAAVDAARRDGASLHFRSMPSEGAAMFAAPFADFARRLLESPRAVIDAGHTAGGLLIRICEVLLASDPPLGATLWRAAVDLEADQPFRKSNGTPEDLAVLFAAPPSEPRDQLIAELWLPGLTGDDEALFTVVHAAESVGADTILDGLIARDLASPRALHQARGRQALSFRANAPLDEALRYGRDQPSAWPHRVAAKAAVRAAKNAAAREWYRRFVSDPDPDRALAAWLLMLEVVDRRFFIWRETVEAAAGAPSRQRLAHLLINRHELNRAIDRNEKGLEKRFLGEEL